MSGKVVACREIDAHSADLNTLSQEIWKHPELQYAETFAHDYLSAFLEKHGFEVERNYKLDTAFRAVFGQDGTGPHVAVLCEYDALPDIGHACGHNLIAEVGVAAGLGVKAALQATGSGGKITVLGTPAEEGGGGKIDLIHANAFKGVDVAMMAHPAPFTTVDVFCLSREHCITGYVTAYQCKVVGDNKDAGYISLLFETTITGAWCTIKFHGKASHAAGFPWEGINALDAAILCYQNVSCLRQQMKPDWRVHGIIKNGGVKSNIIPELTELEYYLRTPSDDDMGVLKEKFIQCIMAAVAATGCKVEYDFDPKSYSNVVTNRSLAKAFTTNANTTGIEFTPKQKYAGLASGSTDMGNVSHVVPSIHPMFYVGVEGCLYHTREFTTASGSPEAQPVTLNVSKALAMTAIDVYTLPGMLSDIKRDFKNDTKYS